MSAEGKEIRDMKVLSKSELKEGIHFYYNQQGYMVLTETYHQLRGFCCKSGCLHCPYGFKKQ